MVIIAFFFLLRTGKYTDSKSNTTPFTLGDMHLVIGNRQLPLATATNAELNQAQFASLTFTTENNGVENKVNHHGISGDPYVCIVKAIKRLVCHLRAHNASLSMPLCCAYTGSDSMTQSVTPTIITKILKDVVDFLGTDLGFLLRNICQVSPQCRCNGVIGCQG